MAVGIAQKAGGLGDSGDSASIGFRVLCCLKTVYQPGTMREWEMSATVNARMMKRLGELGELLVCLLGGRAQYRALQRGTRARRKAVGT